MTYRYIDHLSTKPYPTILEPLVPLGSRRKFGLLVKEWSLVKDQTKFGFGPAGLTYMTGSPGGESDMLADTWEETTKRPWTLSFKTSDLETADFVYLNRFSRN